jgi:drug/metabolite transporter (DMT)-like permease
MKVFLAFVTMITCTVAGNLLLKIGANDFRSSGSWWAILNFKIALGFFSFACAAFVYVLILSRLPLNVAQSFASAGFVAGILAAAIILREPILPVQWIGIAFITLGIALIGWTR